MNEKMGKLDAIETLKNIGYLAGEAPKSLAVCVEAATGDPFRVLVATLLSLRNRDEACAASTKRVLARWPTAEDLARADEDELGEAVRPSSLWRTKVRALREVSRTLMESHLGRVPRTVDELVEIKWIGRKSANLIATLAYGEEGLCVDTHVHRISNRLGIVGTKKPEETELALRAVLPKDMWAPVNDWLVWFGRTTCRPVGPKCGECPVRESCPSRSPRA
jgi:endonuclease-3